jgi:6-phosphogluconolactonase (cycloisomerase 2 family)
MEGLVRRSARFAAVTVTAGLSLLIAVPGSAAAAPADAIGGLLQLSPGNCETDNLATTCDDHVPGGLGMAHGLAISPDGRNVYVASENGALSTFTRDLTTGALTFDRCVKDQASTEACAVNTPNAGDLAGAHAVAVSPDGNYVYVAASMAIPASDAVTVFARDETTGVLTPLTTSQSGKTDECISDSVTACRQAVGLTGITNLAVTDNSVYAVSPSNSTVVRLVRDPATGRLTQPSATTDCFRGTTAAAPTCGSGSTNGLNGASAIAVTPDGANAYVASKVSNALVRFTRDTGTGALSAATCVNTAGPGSECAHSADVPGLNGAQGIAVTNDNVYVAAGPGSTALTGNTLATFTRNPSGGAVTPTQCYRDPTSTNETACDTGITPGLAGAGSIALTSDGQFLYVSASAGNDVAEFARAGADGDLTPLAGSDACVGTAAATQCPAGNRAAKGISGASSVVTAPLPSPDFAYVAGPTDDAVAAFSIQRPPGCVSLGTSLGHGQQENGDLNLLCSDPNARDTLTFTKLTDPTNGTLDLDPTGPYTYTPNSGFSGVDSFRFRASDGHLDSTAESVTFSVNPEEPAVVVDDATTDEGDTGQHLLQFNVSLSGARPYTVIVHYATSDGSAQGGSDYTGAAGTLTFDPGDTSKTIDVPVNGDTAFEPDETFTVTLSNASGGVLVNGAKTATGKILNDDQAPPESPLTVKLTGFPSQITRAKLLNKGVKFREVANRAVRFDNDLLGTPRGTGQGTSTKFSVELATQQFPFGPLPRNVTLRPSAADVGPKSTFRLRVRIVATDGAGNRVVRKKGIKVVPPPAG